MSSRPPTHSTRFPQPELAEAAAVLARGECDRSEEGLARQPVAALALAAVIFFLMFTPAVVAGASLLDSKLVDRLQGWLSWSGEPMHYLDLARFGSTFVLSVFLAKA